MYSIKVEGNFSAAHNLRSYRGKCEELHGHNWKVEIIARKDKLDKTGMVLDFKYLKAELNKVLDVFDHKYLNKTGYFKNVNPTSENMAAFLYRRLKARISSLKSVTVWENPTSSATYEE